MQGDEGELREAAAWAGIACRLTPAVGGQVLQVLVEAAQSLDGCAVVQLSLQSAHTLDIDQLGQTGPEAGLNCEQCSLSVSTSNTCPNCIAAICYIKQFMVQRVMY